MPAQERDNRKGEVMREHSNKDEERGAGIL
jgi:hypothetical protein